LDQEVDQSEPVFKSTQTALSAPGGGNACVRGSFCAKSRHSAVKKVPQPIKGQPREAGI